MEKSYEVLELKACRNMMNFQVCGALSRECRAAPRASDLVESVHSAASRCRSLQCCWDHVASCFWSPEPLTASTDERENDSSKDARGAG